MAFFDVQFNGTRRSKISNSKKRKCIKMIVCRHFSKTVNICFFLRVNGSEMTLLTMRHIFTIFPDDFDQKRVF